LKCFPSISAPPQVGFGPPQIFRLKISKVHRIKDFFNINVKVFWREGDEK